MKFVHFLVLTGGGDTMIHLITQEALDWINSDIPAFPIGIFHLEDVGVPDAIQDNPDRHGELVTVSSGSPYNDRMLACPLNMFEGEIEVPSHFEGGVKNIMAIAEAVQIAGYEVGESLEGYIY